ncbi:MAG: DUF992 domain-containing protein [Caulobacteraceae bacterium]
MNRKFLCAALAGAFALATPMMVSAHRGGVKVGTLTCHESSGWGYVVGGSHRLACVFDGDGRVEHYRGAISKFGVDIGYQGSGTLVWAVFAPTSNLRRGDLRGHYGGVTGGAAVGVGAAGNVLIGGNDHSIQLQPVSIEGMTGVNVAAGIGELTLG